MRSHRASVVGAEVPSIRTHCEGMPAGLATGIFFPGGAMRSSGAAGAQRALIVDVHEVVDVDVRNAFERKIEPHHW